MTHRQFTWRLLGRRTTCDKAWADVSLNSPPGNRPVVRSSGLTHLLVLAQGHRFIPKHPVSADMKRYGGLNDTPPLRLQKEVLTTAPGALADLAARPIPCHRSCLACLKLMNCCQTVILGVKVSKVWPPSTVL
jgi:hypothetical protein